jgi:hypothetical protein
MKAGDRVVLFLVSGWGKPSAATPSYYIAGGWAGLATIIDGKILVSPRNSTELKASENLTETEFLKLVDDTISHRNVVLKKTESRSDIPFLIQTDQR